jgi:hypothetical protein
MPGSKTINAHRGATELRPHDGKQKDKCPPWGDEAAAAPRPSKTINAREQNDKCPPWGDGAAAAPRPSKTINAHRGATELRPHRPSKTINAHAATPAKQNDKCPPWGDEAAAARWEAKR